MKLPVGVTSMTAIAPDDAGAVDRNLDFPHSEPLEPGT
jgi:hypothetical protein